MIRAVEDSKKSNDFKADALPLKADALPLKADALPLVESLFLQRRGSSACLGFRKMERLRRQSSILFFPLKTSRQIPRCFRSGKRR
jgi:hypothetical protein